MYGGYFALLCFVVIMAAWFTDHRGGPKGGTAVVCG